MAPENVGVAENLQRISSLLTHLQYSRVEAQELTNDELRQNLTDFLTHAIAELRRGQEEARLCLLRSILAHDVKVVDDRGESVPVPISAPA